MKETTAELEGGRNTCPCSRVRPGGCKWAMSSIVKQYPEEPGCCCLPCQMGTTSHGVMVSWCHNVMVEAEEEMPRYRSCTQGAISSTAGNAAGGTQLLMVRA